MILRHYLASLTVEQRNAFRERLGYHRMYVSAVANGHRNPSAQMAKDIERASDGVVPRWESRPDIWDPPPPRPAPAPVTRRKRAASKNKRRNRRPSSSLIA